MKIYRRGFCNPKKPFKKIRIVDVLMDGLILAVINGYFECLIDGNKK